MTAALTWLLGVFPPAFRRRFEADMAEQIREDYARARERGMFAAIAFVLGTALDAGPGRHRGAVEPHACGRA